MSKKHFIAIARTLKLTRATLTTPVQQQTFADAVDSLILVLSASNPRFDRDKFLKAIY